MKRRGVIAIVVCALICSGFAEAQLKKRIAVARFEDRSGGGWTNVGEGVADMLVTALVKSKKFMVIERQELEKVLDEQRLGQDGVLTPETAPKAGKILGVELIVVGSITEFGLKEREIAGGIGDIGAGITHKSARAAIDLRLVNTTTGEIIAAETEEGSESTLSFGGQYENIDFRDVSTWNTTDVGKACREAINGCVDLITESAPKIPWSGKILRLNADGTVIMKPGSEGGVSVGDEFTVFRPGEELKDPDTGQTLGAEETNIGSLKIIEDMMKGKTAKARVERGTVQVGDIVREK